MIKLFQPLYFVIIFALIQSNVMGQSNSFAIKIVDQQNKAVIGATVKVQLKADSTKQFYQITDTLGLSKFNLLTRQKYRVKVSSIGFITFFGDFEVNNKINKVSFVLNEDTKMLGGVTVTAKKQLIRQEEDKTIVDPEPLAASSTNAYELLEKIPGIFVDNDGNIYINGSSPSSIYINGREQKMSASDVATILKSLPPNSIEKIELMRTSSAKYDAASSGGVVNIVLKKGLKIGRTGTINAGVNQGKFGNQFLGINLQNSDGDKSSYLNININHRNYFEQIETSRKLNNALLTQKSYNTTPNYGSYIGYGLGRTLPKKLELNVDGRLSLNKNKSNNSNINNIINSNSILPIANNQNFVENEGYNYNLSQGIVLKKNLDSLGSNLTFDASYNYLSKPTDQSFITDFILPKLQSQVGSGFFENNRHLVETKLDFTKKYSNKITIEAGYKSTFQLFNSSTDFYNLNGNVKMINLIRSNKYKYVDAIHAAYLQGSKTFGSYILKAGIRGENTNMAGKQLSGKDTSFNIHRTDFFPYLFFSRKVIKIAGFELRAFLIAKRSITRPAYEYLNPAVKYLDQYLYETGNPSLRPQFTNTYEANISVDDRPIFAIGCNYTQDIFTNVVYQDPSNKAVSIRTYDNLGKNKETYFRALGAIPPGGKYFFVVSVQYNLNDYVGKYENSPFTFKRGSWTIFTFHQLKLDQRSTFQMGGFIRTKGQQQFYELGNFGSTFASINRYFLDKKLLVTLNANDLFYTNQNTFTLKQGNIDAFGKRNADTRRFGVNIRYNFGRKKREDGNNPFNMDMEKSGN